MQTKGVQVTQALAVAVLFLSLVSCAYMRGDYYLFQSGTDEVRESVQSMVSDTLTQLISQYPETRTRLQNAAGYAAFSNFGIKYLVMGSAEAQGIVKNNATEMRTFMKMVEFRPGYGFGAQRFKIVLVFDTQDTLNAFLNSAWEFESSAAAAAQTSTQGQGARMGVAVSPGITIYQLSGANDLVSISIRGARFYQDSTLN